MPKCKVIAVAEIKGGTGKTTTAAAMGQKAVLDEKRVLVIDLDPQANISTLFGAKPTKPGAYQLLNGYPARELIQSTVFGVDVIAGSLNLADEVPQKGSAYRLRDAIAPLLGDYDLIVIDTPPDFGEMTYNALHASTGLLCALEADTKALQGFYMITDLAKAARAQNKRLKLLGCIITRYDGRPIINQRMKNIIEEKAGAVKCPYLGEIRRGVAVPEAQAYQLNLFEKYPKSAPAQDYIRVFDQIFAQ